MRTVETFALVAKSLLAVMLLVAGGSKLADLASFAAAVRLFVPRRVGWDVVRRIAAGVAMSEVVLGVGSLSWPSAGWVNLLVLAFACGFVAISLAGYVFHRGRSCRCFGALSKRKFDAAGVLRSIGIGGVAAISTYRVGPTLVNVGTSDGLLLFLAGSLVALAAFTAARSLNMGRREGLVMG